MQTLSAGPGLVEQAYRAILDAICDGRLRPGERLAQERIADRLGVSRQPIGQALGLLETQGFVERAGRRGLAVAPLAPSFVRDHYEFRGAVDALAAAKAAERRSEADLAEGRRLLARGRAAVAEGPVGRLIDADTAFHHWLYQTAGNPIMAQAMAQQWQHTRRAMSAVLEMSGGWPAKIWDEHAAILDAVAAGRADEAARLARAHTETAARALLQALDGESVA